MTTAGKFFPKDWKTNSFTNHMNLIVLSSALTEQGKVNAVTNQLGHAIGLGDFENAEDVAPKDKTDIMAFGCNSDNQDSFNDNWHVSQSDLDHIDWIYSHPYTNINDNPVYYESRATEF
ncbi:hypothetical protein FP435_03630 [Lactobacillus sp. PV037]|uniref:hypothetical protein n=1 Tax=Lactobacillus sp. PV037 TaxID=2594496 RepID=UPI00223F5E50|nr:hypothetical protein [Lactobacillus sp. PV037]QNQ83598.1 hypothetical protein FP435_03630 [Lactobacillus sp. PV037]